MRLWESKTEDAFYGVMYFGGYLGNSTMLFKKNFDLETEWEAGYNLATTFLSKFKKLFMVYSDHHR